MESSANGSGGSNFASRNRRPTEVLTLKNVRTGSASADNIRLTTREDDMPPVIPFQVMSPRMGLRPDDVV